MSCAERLLEAAAKNDTKTIKELLKQDGIVVDDKAGGKQTALVAAAKGKAPDAIDLLIAAKADVNSQEDETDLTALHYACRGGNQMALGVLALVDAGADVSLLAKTTGSTPLDEAGFVPPVQHALLTSLLSRMELSNTPPATLDFIVALCAASALGDVERSKAVLSEFSRWKKKQQAGGGAESAGARNDGVSEVLVNGRDVLGRTAIHWACRGGMMSCAHFLLGKGANPEVRANPDVDRVWKTELWDSRLWE
eukprot:CAMPEP_0181344060 /NCGR_PEP_ID=MMETSP1101-20121128/31959_1 /TAXON_ID=46948 /ORGANISM="Rhodomonas abbreviata, Strain Caron Lab Isolate" /LENGTH=251 /DNA_ID=CAMNT_0023455813 /DNA_START=106 /DNA_END=858 /DNA_ORIENTATION=+